MPHLSPMNWITSILSILMIILISSSSMWWTKPQLFMKLSSLSNNKKNPWKWSL